MQFYGIDVHEVLKRVQLPGDMLSRKNPSMTEMQYYDFMNAIENTSDDEELIIKLSSADAIEMFSPPIFAAYCAQNGLSCIKRLSRYKQLIGPMQFLITENEKGTAVKIAGGDEHVNMPGFLIGLEFVFLTNILRKATNKNIIHLSVKMKSVSQENTLSRFLQCGISKGDDNSIIFACEDLALPFVSYNESMWNYFEPELNKRLEEIEMDSSTGARVRSALSEMLPAGECGIDEIAIKLGLSKRTLQMKLKEEGTIFQKQLNSVRETLAIHYIGSTQMSISDIAFLLGYAETNSFLRAFVI